MESKQAVVGAEIRIKDFLASNLLVQLSCFLVMCPVLLSLCLLYHSAWFYKYHKCEEDMFPFFFVPSLVVRFVPWERRKEGLDAEGRFRY